MFNSQKQNLCRNSIGRFNNSDQFSVNIKIRWSRMVTIFMFHIFIPIGIKRCKTTLNGCNGDQLPWLYGQKIETSRVLFLGDIYQVMAAVLVTQNKIIRLDIVCTFKL